MEPAAPAGGEAREEPGFSFTWSETGAPLLTCVTLAGSLQVHVPHEVPTKRGAAGLLDVQENDHVVPLDVEIHDAIQVFLGEVVAGDEAGQSSVLCDVRIFRRPVVALTPRGARREPAHVKPRSHLEPHVTLGVGGTHVLDHNHPEEQHQEQDDRESVATASAAFPNHLPRTDANSSLRPCGGPPGAEESNVKESERGKNGKQ